MSWILAMTKSNQEVIAADNLQRQGYQFYCPKFKQKHPNKPTVIKPLFPRYIFVDIDNIWTPIRSTRGISHILMAEEGPQKVPEAVISKLREREDKQGYISLLQKSRFELGARVKTSDGPLAGLTLIYDGMTAHERCAVLADILGRYVRIALEEKVLLPA